ncbi:hypothetical protein D6779_08235 [Candidatus Parcubacteria bacterium]|nr:MAG: hypothetical protein D6779_08235 [Candidatus Parcubacteria bacterium]
MNVHLAERFHWGSDTEGLKEDVASELQGIGVTWAREEFNWSQMETVKGTINWNKTDEAIQAYKEQGIEILGLLSYTPEWARDETVTSECDDFRYRPPKDFGT